MPTQSPRVERYYGGLLSDQRSEAQRDRDRIPYSAAFLRLTGVTQVVSPAENRVCHNRLIHSIKVGQVARRLAEQLIRSNAVEALDSVGGLDPDVAEAASLAHDLGHPPFGHAAETELQACMRQKVGDSETFEGNAQSFRVVTKLAVRSADFGGLDLTRATPNALLKYPWTWEGRKKPDKWGAYADEESEFEWARRTLPDDERDSRTLEAEIMDTADDISYAVHDLEDFYRVGMVPLDRLIGPDAELTEAGEEFTSGVFFRKRSSLPASPDDLRSAFVSLLDHRPVAKPYRGLREERAALRAFTSMLIGRYVKSAVIRRNETPGMRLRLPEQHRNEIFMLQQLTWHYMILNPALETQRVGQRRMIRELFEFYFEAIKADRLSLIPPRGREMVEAAPRMRADALCARLAADLIAGMTEPEVRIVAHRILGIDSGSAFESFA